MAHKTLVNGTAYDIAGGKTLVEGTSYSVKNGKVLIDGTEHDISLLLPAVALDVWTSDYKDCTIKCIVNRRGYWVVGGICNTDDRCYARIAYATNLDGPWTIKDLWSGSLICDICGIGYGGGGYWIVAGNYSASKSSHPEARIAYTTSLEGDWTINTLWKGVGSHMKCIKMAASYIVVGGTYDSGTTSYARIAYAASPSSTWTTKDLWSGYSAQIDSINWGNSSWVAAGICMLSTTSSNNYQARIAYKGGPPSGTWTTKDLWNGHKSATIMCVTYANNYWVVGGEHNLSSARIAYRRGAPSSRWTIKTLWSGSTNHINSITYANGYWAACGYYWTDGNSRSVTRIAYVSGSPSGTWTTKDMWGSDTLYNSMETIIYADNKWVVGGVYYTSDSGHARIAYTENLDDFDKL